jgi:hypothetical protein
MFVTGILVGWIAGLGVALVAVLHMLGREAERAHALRPALVPLHVSSATLVSLN